MHIFIKYILKIKKLKKNKIKIFCFNFKFNFCYDEINYLLKCPFCFETNKCYLTTFK